MGSVIWIEGLIGAGKTDAAEELAQILNFRVFKEPVEQEHLSAFYEDPYKEAFPFQIRQAIRRRKIHKLAVAEAGYGGDYKGAILDRGLPGDKVFADMHHRAGNINDRQLDTYNLLFEEVMIEVPRPSVLLFLDTDPSIALERVKKRGRKSEENMTINYLQDLRKGYLDLIGEVEAKLHPWSAGITIIRKPWNVDHQDVTVLAGVLKDHLRLKN